MAYYSSSPQEFYYACEGYFAERDEHINLMRNVALFASQLGGNDFNKYWPSVSGDSSRENIVITDEMRQKIMQAHKIKL